LPQAARSYAHHRSYIPSFKGKRKPALANLTGQVLIKALFITSSCFWLGDHHFDEVAGIGVKGCKKAGGLSQTDFLADDRGKIDLALIQ